MKDIWLVILVAAIMLFGFFLMKRLDVIIAANEAGKNGRGNAKHLRIAFANPLVADTIALPLERLSKRHPELKVNLYSGAEDTIIQKMYAGEFDVVFLPQLAKCADLPMCDKMYIVLRQGKVVSSVMDNPVIPIDTECIKQCIVWRKHSCDGCSDELLKQIKNGE